jgi:hypothetical protein
MAGAHLKILRVADGATADYYDEYFEWPESEFIWTEGNYSCDCNRALFFAWAREEEEPTELACSTGKYRVFYGDVFYGEEELVAS